MANRTVIDTQNYGDLFRRRVLRNAYYWRDYLSGHADEVTALDNEREPILTAISFALELDVAWPCAREMADAFSPYMERRGHWDVWNRLLHRAIEAARRNGDVAAEVGFSALLARLLAQQSRFKEATACYRQTIRLARQIDDRFNEARACTNLGYYYIEQGQWYRAEVLCCYALKIFEQLDNNHGRAHTENHLGTLYYRQHRWQQARRRLERACAIWQTMRDEHGLMRGFINLGSLHTDLKQSNKALRYLEKAMRLAWLTGEKTEIGTIYMNIGRAYRLGEDLEKAEAYTRQAETIFRRFSNLAGLAQVWDNLGVICFHRGKRPEAVSYLERSLETWRNLGNKIEEIEVLMDIVECELTGENWPEAEVRLKEVEHLIQQDNKKGPYHHVQACLAKYRRSLAEQSLNKSGR